MELSSGDWGAVEIRLGRQHIDDAAKKLKILEAKMLAAGVNAPSFLMVLSGIDYAYRRKEDGVLVVPIGCLKN